MSTNVETSQNSTGNRLTGARPPVSRNSLTLPGALVMALFASAAWAQAEVKTPPAQPARLAQVAQYLAEQQQTLRIPGMSAAVLLPDEPIWSAAWGLTDVENAVAAQPESVYRIGAISTGITALAVLQLIEKIRPSFETSVREYVPELPDKGEKITIRQLLAQQSGIRSYRNDEERLSRKSYPDLRATLEVFKDDPLRAPPGTRFLPTPYGYNLLGLVVERVSGLGLEDYLKRNVFKPAGMKATTLEDLQRITPHRARGYERTGKGELRNSYFVDLSMRAPGMGMVSTAEDLARLAQALYAHKLLTPEMFTVMTTPQRTSAGTETPFGLGWYIQQKQGHKVVGFAGLERQASGVLFMVPDEQVAVALLCNLERANLTDVALHVLELLRGNEIEARTADPPATVDTPPAAPDR